MLTSKIVNSTKTYSLKIAQALFIEQTVGLMRIALKMLLSQKNKFIGMIIGATFAAFIMTQQPAIYLGITGLTTYLISSTPEPDLWVMNKTTPSLESPTVFTPLDIYRVRSIPGVLWARHLVKIKLKGLHVQSGGYTGWQIVGVDQKTLLGLPTRMVVGEREAIRKNKAIIIDSASQKQTYNNKEVIIRVNDQIELIDTNSVNVVGVAKPLRTLGFDPMAYMTIDAMKKLFPDKSLNSFILVKAKPGVNTLALAQRIYNTTGYIAYTAEQFKKITRDYYEERTPIIINFAIVSALGFIIGLVSIGQIFYTLTLSHLYQFGMLKILGATNKMLAKMIFFQAFLVGGLGYLLGTLLAILFGIATRDTMVAYQLTWGVLMLAASAIAIIILAAAYLSIRIVFKFDTVDLCRNDT